MHRSALVVAVCLTPALARAGPPGPEPLTPPIKVVVTIPPPAPEAAPAPGSLPSPATAAEPVPVKASLPFVSLDFGTTEATSDDFFTARYEPAGLPLIGGNSDIGFQFGAAATLTRFGNGARPYAWNMDFVLNTSVKGGSGDGIQFAQQNYLWNWDIPDLLGGSLRLNPVIYYQRTVDQGFFGLGNASSAAAHTASPRYYQYLDSELRARQLARIRLAPGYELGLLGTFRAEAPTAYPGTLLATEANAKNTDGTALLRGVQPDQRDNQMGIGMIGAGVIYDTRDNEVFPRSGAYHQVGLRGAQGFPLVNDVRYGAFGANFTWLAPLDPHRAVVLAARLVADLEFGDVPFYDLYTGGPFNSSDMPGGASGIRGVPSGRYLGRIKAIGNVELRSLPIAFHFLGQTFHLGGDVFFDTGRIWYDYTFRSPLDGSGVGLKYGTGAGLYALWGQAALFRVEVAYSPDQVAENPGFPVGIYVEDGLMF